MSWIELTVAVSSVAIGAMIQGSVGIGLAIVSAPVLILIDPRFIPGPLLCAALALTALMVYRDRQAVDLSGLQWALLGRLIGTAAGLMALTLISTDRLTLTFGLLVLLSVAISLSGIHMRPTRSTLIGAGSLSGFMGTTSSIGGPPMALIYQHAPGARIRGTLAGFFIVGVSISLVALAAIGRLGRTEFTLALILLPGIVTGFAISSRTARVFDRGYTQPAVLTVAGIMGLIVVLRQVLQ